MSAYELAQLNIATMKEPLESAAATYLDHHWYQELFGPPQARQRAL